MLWWEQYIKITKLRAIFPESVWAKGSSNSGCLLYISISSHVVITSSHSFHIFTSSHCIMWSSHPIFTSSHLIFSFFSSAFFSCCSLALLPFVSIGHHCPTAEPTCWNRNPAWCHHGYIRDVGMFLHKKQNCWKFIVSIPRFVPNYAMAWENLRDPSARMKTWSVPSERFLREMLNIDTIHLDHRDTNAAEVTRLQILQ